MSPFFVGIEDGSNYSGINGNVSLNRQGELVTTPQHRYDLSLSSDKSSSLSRSEGGVYDVVQAESRIIQQNENIGNIVNNDLYPLNGHTSLDSRDGDASKLKKVHRINVYCIKSHVKKNDNSKKIN